MSHVCKHWVSRTLLEVVAPMARGSCECETGSLPTAAAGPGQHRQAYLPDRTAGTLLHGLQQCPVSRCQHPPASTTPGRVMCPWLCKLPSKPGIQTKLQQPACQMLGSLIVLWLWRQQDWGLTSPCLQSDPCIHTCSIPRSSAVCHGNPQTRMAGGGDELWVPSSAQHPIPDTLLPLLPGSALPQYQERRDLFPSNQTAPVSPQHHVCPSHSHRSNSAFLFYQNALPLLPEEGGTELLFALL